MMGSIIIWLTLALVSVGGEIMGEECFKLEPIYREISTEDLERGIVEVVEKHEIQLSRFRNLPQGLRSLREPDVVGQRVAELMARTSNKSAKPGFLRGYTVDQLCKINTWENNDEDCGETEFQRRTTICSAFKSSGVKTISQLDSGVNTYCSLALAEMRSSCAKWLSGKKVAEFEQLFRPYHRVAENLDSTEDHSVKSILARMDRKDADELISHCKRLCKNYKFIGLPGRYQDWDYYRQQCKAIKSVKLKRNCFTL